MANGFGQFHSSGYSLTGGSSVTAVKTSAYVSQSVNLETRKVTITVQTGLSLYRISGNWNITYNTPVASSTGYSSNYMLAKCGNLENKQYSSNLGIYGNKSFKATTGGIYSIFDGYCRVWPGYLGLVSQSKTYDFPDSGAAISDTWKCEMSYADTVLTVSGTFTTDPIPAKYGSPANVSGTNLTSDGTDGKARVQISVSAWGLNTDEGFFVANKQKNLSTPISNQAWGMTSTDAPLTKSFYWAGLAPSTSTSKCEITTWYPIAVNEAGIPTTGTVKYIASPQAPNVTITDSTSTPKVSVSATANYRGGEQNVNCDTASIANWSLHYRKVAQGSALTQSDRTTTTDTSYSNNIARSTFKTGFNYEIATRIQNQFGAYATDTKTIYCPTGVTGAISDITPRTFVVSVNATQAGTIGTPTGGTMADYKVKWSTNRQTVEDGGGEETAFGTGPFTISNLTQGTTYYCRVYGWNSFGLCNKSPVYTVTTINRYSPESNELTISPTSFGGTVALEVAKTGGLTEGEEEITELALYGRPVNGVYKLIGDPITGLHLSTGDVYTMTNAWTSTDIDAPGDWEFRVYMSNGTDTGYSPVTLIKSPTGLAMAVADSEIPVQIIVDASANAQGTMKQWVLQYKVRGEEESKEKNLTTASVLVSLATDNHLEYDTEYEVKALPHNTYGLWTEPTTPLIAKTPARFSWSAVLNGDGNERPTTPTFVHNNNGSSITECYLVCKDSLGSKGVGDDLRGLILNFINQPINYRPENVASIELDGGKIIAYALDESEDTYKFGIWEDGEIVETFYDGYEWVDGMTHYDIPDTSGYEIVAVNPPMNGDNNLGMNASAAFSTTSCSNIPMWENN